MLAMTYTTGERADQPPDLLTLFTAHYASLMRLAAFLLKDPNTCEDVVQEAFIRVSSKSLRDPEHTLAYLRQTVVNLCRSHIRRRLVALRHAPALAQSPTVDHDIYRAIECDALVRALRHLPARQREAVVLRHYADLSEAETADAMGVSVGAVKSYTSRGLAALAAQMETLR